MLDLTNHNNRSNYRFCIYIVLGVKEQIGIFYVGRHKCCRKGIMDGWYFGGGKFMNSLRKQKGQQYIKENFIVKPIYWCTTMEESAEWEKYFINYYEATEVGMNKTEGGEVGGPCGNRLAGRRKYWNHKFGNTEQIPYSKEEMDEFSLQSRRERARAYKASGVYDRTEADKRYRNKHKNDKKQTKKTL